MKNVELLAQVQTLDTRTPLIFQVPENEASYTVNNFFLFLPLPSSSELQAYLHGCLHGFMGWYYSTSLDT